MTLFDLPQCSLRQLRKILRARLTPVLQLNFIDSIILPCVITFNWHADAFETECPQTKTAAPQADAQAPCANDICAASAHGMVGALLGTRKPDAYHGPAVGMRAEARPVVTANTAEPLRAGACGAGATVEGTTRPRRRANASSRATDKGGIP